MFLRSLNLSRKTSAFVLQATTQLQSRSYEESSIGSLNSHGLFWLPLALSLTHSHMVHLMRCASSMMDAARCGQSASQLCILACVSTRARETHALRSGFIKVPFSLLTSLIPEKCEHDLTDETEKLNYGQEDTPKPWYVSAKRSQDGTRPSQVQPRGEVRGQRSHDAHRVHDSQPKQTLDAREAPCISMNEKNRRSGAHWSEVTSHNLAAICCCTGIGKRQPL